MSKPLAWAIHAVIIAFSAMTLLPFLFVVNNSLRSNSEMYHSFFGLPRSLVGLAEAGTALATGNGDRTFELEDVEGDLIQLPAREAAAEFVAKATKGYRLAWKVLRPYMVNTFFVVSVAAVGVLLSGSITAYILSRYRFFGSRFVYLYIISVLMFPGVLTLVPLYMTVKDLGLLDTYWAMVLPYIAGGQVFATFVFKGFFDGLPEDLFESARIDGAGHAQLYLNIVVPLSKAILSVVLIMNVMGNWNNFMWPFITNTSGKYHVVASGLYVMATSNAATNMSTLYAAYMVSSIPLLILFIYATKPFIEGVTAGAFKA